MSIFTNQNPTNTERKLFCYAGFYKVEDTYNCMRYVRIHANSYDTFPEHLEIEDRYVEYKKEITFYHSSETVTMHGDFDGTMISLIDDRMTELGWQI